MNPPKLTPDQGLTSSEAAARLQADGPNELTPPKPRTPWHIALEVAREPMFQLLLAAGILYLFLGDMGEALMLLAFVAMTVAITVVQEQRTEKALEALRDLTSPHARVVRDGQTQTVPSRELVVGDLLVLTEGDRVAADAWVWSASDLQADESLLTGEAVPVGKTAADSQVFGGTMLVSGGGMAQVTATGARSEIGRIGKALDTITTPPTPLHVQTRKLVRIFSVLGLGLSLVVIGLYGWTRGDWMGGLLAGITLAMSMLPQEFPLILTVFMAMGAWRLSRQQVLARRASTIETLGSATVLCTDKTGTLTQNHMAIVELTMAQGAKLATWAAADNDFPLAFHPVVEFGILASELKPFDPMDKAFLALGVDHLPEQGVHADWTLVYEYGLAPDLMAMTHIWQVPGSSIHTVAIKGSHEAVVALCHLPAEQVKAINLAADGMATRGLRVLAVASSTFEGNAWPDSPHGFTCVFLGLVALADPLRDAVPAAVQECLTAGIRVVMITGDHPVTALAIAAQAGLGGYPPDKAAGSDKGDMTVMAGTELQTLGAEALHQRVAAVTVFARVKPEQKLRIVEALKQTGQVVAMTGDGVNDAPSLKAAHIGIAMGKRGTDVAREASSLVLLDDDFGAIVHAIRLGRRIYDNLLKAMAFVLAVHVPIAGLSLLPLLFGLPLVFTPVHIAFLELLIDPVCSIVFEAEDEEADVMTRPPRDPAAPLFSGALILSSLLQGGLVLLAVGGLFVGLLQASVPEALARAASFTALVFCSLALIIANRSFSDGLMLALRRPNPALWRVVAGALALLGVVLYIAPLRKLFRFDPLTPDLLGVALALGIAVLLVIAGVKQLQGRYKK